MVTHGKRCAECRAGGKNGGKCESRRAFGKKGKRDLKEEDEVISVKELKDEERETKGENLSD